MPGILLWNVVYEGDFSEIIKRATSMVKRDNITIYYVCNWEKLAKELALNIEKIGKRATLRDFIGCERYHVDGDVVICDGRFHLGCFEGKFIWVNPMQNEVIEMEKKHEMDKRLPYAMTKRHFGIILSVKPGQFRMGLAKEIKKILEDLGKKVYMFVGNEIRDLKNFPFIEVWINTACPRLKDDFREILFFNAEEFLKYLGDNLNEN